MTKKIVLIIIISLNGKGNSVLLFVWHKVWNCKLIYLNLAMLNLIMIVAIFNFFFFFFFFWFNSGTTWELWEWFLLINNWIEIIQLVFLQPAKFYSYGPKKLPLSLTQAALCWLPMIAVVVPFPSFQVTAAVQDRTKPNWFWPVSYIRLLLCLVMTFRYQSYSSVYNHGPGFYPNHETNNGQHTNQYILTGLGIELNRTELNSKPGHSY